MDKRNISDVVSDAHERANHNINPYYWLNRVKSSTWVQTKTDRRFAPLFFLVFSMFLIVWILALNDTASSENKTFWSYFFDFSNSFSIGRFLGTILMILYWVGRAITGLRTAAQRVYSGSMQSELDRKKEKKKKYPKRPKNYK